MILKKIKNFISEFRENQIKQKNQLAELEWAHVYHDSIRGFSEIENLPLNIGRWAGNYSFFYVLYRILETCKPSNIVEFGLGESSKFISTYIESGRLSAKHEIIEQSEEWKNQFENNFQLSPSSIVIFNKMVRNTIEGFEVNCYENLKLINCEADFYVIDGPHGSKRFSRFDIVNVMKNFRQDKKFIILLDDYNRIGEKDTARRIEDVLKEKDISFVTGLYEGNKSQYVIASSNYKFISSF
jgi:hypothetical protein